MSAPRPGRRPEADRARELADHGALLKRDACDGKTGYDSKNDARHAAKTVGRKHDRRYAVYSCPFCPKYHLTKFKHGEDE